MAIDLRRLIHGWMYSLNRALGQPLNSPSGSGEMAGTVVMHAKEFIQTNSDGTCGSAADRGDFRRRILRR